MRSITKRKEECILRVWDSKRDGQVGLKGDAKSIITWRIEAGAVAEGGQGGGDAECVEFGVAVTDCRL